MAARESVSLSLQADISDLKRSLGEIPGVTKREAAKMTRELQTQYNKAQRAAQKAAKATKASWADTASSAAMVGTALTGAAVAVVAFGQTMADLNNELTDTATRTGLLVEQVAGLRLAGQGSGVEFAKLENGLNRLPKAMTDAAKGTGAAAGAFERLGVAVEDADTGALRPASEVFADVTSALGSMDDQALKSATAMEIFGTKAGGALVQSGALENLDAFVALATEFGVDVGPKATQAAADFQREMALLRTVSQGVAQDLLQQLGGAGGLNDALRLATEGVILFGAVFGSTFEAISDAFGMVVGPIAEVAASLSRGDFAGALQAAKRNGMEFGEGLLRTTNMVGLAATVAEGAIDGVGDGLERIQKLRKLADATGTPVVSGAAPGAAAAAPTTGAAESTKQTDAAIRDLDRLRAAQQKASEARLSERAKIELSFEREIETIARAMEAGADLDEAQTAINVAQTERLIALADLKQRLHDEEMQRMRDEAAEAARLTQATVAATADAFGALSGLASTAATAMAESGSAGAKKNAQLMFGVSKALAAAMIPLRLAEALMTATAQPPPINGIMAATAIATAAAQTAAIASAKPPTFDRGGIVHGGTGDQVAASVLPGEAILSREAVANIGRQGVDDLNSGRGMGGPTVVQMVYRHRVFDEFVQDNISAPTPLGTALRGDRVTGRRS